MKFVLGIVFSFLFSSTFSQSTSKMEIRINGIRNTKGHVLIAVFRSADGFPDKKEKAFIRERIPATTGTLSVSLKDIPAGRYAIAVIHDENDNLQLDTGLFGIPKEGFCFSNDAKGTFGPPSFDAAAFYFGSATSPRILSISYW
jgi:uncharacterized protein (DUF2141 family)